jgi:hypothetical protein
MKDDLQRTALCIPIERFDGEFTPAERQHLAECARCQTEHALWREFTDAVPAADEGASVQWIAAEVRRRRTDASAKGKVLAGRWSWPTTPLRWAAVAASLILAAGVGYVAWDREPSVPRTTEDAVYRSARVEAVQPLGDLDTPPRELTWVAVAGAVRYDVRVLEVDRSVLWSATAATPQVPLPPAVVARCVPGRTVLWEVDAVGQSGDTVARSGTQRFRVRVTAPTGRD